MQNNPLRQYFRRPAVYIKLPSGGKIYSKDVVNLPENGELPVYPMTAIDEITIRTPDALFNGNAVPEVIKSCVPAIKDPWGLISGDLDAVLVGIRAAGGQNNLEVDSTCPSCQDSSTFGVNLVGLLSTLKMADYSIPLEMNDLEIKLRPMTYREVNSAALNQFDVQKSFGQIEKLTDEKEKLLATQEAIKKITEVTMMLLTQSIEYIKTPDLVVTEKEYIIDFLKNCDSNVYQGIRDYNTKLKSSTDLKPLQITCASCQNQYEQPFTLNASDFFG